MWDAKLAEVGDQFGHARATLVARLTPMVVEAYEQLAGAADARSSCATTRRGGDAGLAAALAAARADDVRRGVVARSARTATSSSCRSTGMPARTHASQGEQRTLALALRLAAHRLVAERDGHRAGAGARRRAVSELDPRPGDGAAAPPAAGSGRDHDGRRAARRRPAPTRSLRIDAGAVRRR